MGPEFRDLFISGSVKGCLKYWTLNFNEEQAKILNAHNSRIKDLAWHPLGHVLVTVSENDVTKLWGRNQPGDVTFNEMQSKIKYSNESYRKNIQKNKKIM